MIAPQAETGWTFSLVHHEIEALTPSLVNHIGTISQYAELFLEARVRNDRPAHSDLATVSCAGGMAYGVHWVEGGGGGGGAVEGGGGGGEIGNLVEEHEARGLLTSYPSIMYAVYNIIV